MKKVIEFLKRNFIGFTLGALFSIFIGASAATILNGTDIQYTGNKVENVSNIQDAIDVLYTKTKAKKWSAGDIVTFAGEQFHVLNDVYEGQTTVELFAKTNLNTAATVQANAVSSTTKCAFSSTSYWSSSWVSGTRLNLNLYSGFQSTDAIGKAISYASSKGAIGGRLLTYDEANTMKSSSSTAVFNMYKGTGNTAQNYELYWLGSSDDIYYTRVYLVNGGGISIYSTPYDDSGAYGIRPVLTVFASQIS